MGMDLGHFIELSPVTFNKINLMEAWLKVDIEKASEVPHSLLVNLPDGAFMIGVKVFSSYKALWRDITGFSSCSSHGSCCWSSPSVNLSPPTSLSSGMGSVWVFQIESPLQSSSSSSQTNSPCWFSSEHGIRSWLHFRSLPQ